MHREESRLNFCPTQPKGHRWSLTRRFPLPDNHLFMAHSSVKILLAGSLAALLGGCSLFGGFWGPVRDAWRKQAEERCLASGKVKMSAYVQPLSEVDGPGTCGADHPLKVTAFANGSVGISEPAKLTCPMVAAL